MLEAIAKVEALSGRKLETTYSDKARTGDHICYYSDLAKMRRDYPNWKISWPLDDLLEAMVKSETSREPAPAA
jgi:CDP-paratose 2-epimerase